MFFRGLMLIIPSIGAHHGVKISIVGSLELHCVTLGSTLLWPHFPTLSPTLEPFVDHARFQWTFPTNPYSILASTLAPKITNIAKKTRKSSVRKAALNKSAPEAHPKRPNVSSVN